jgi:iron complex transport system substrate-binding protein
LANKLRRLGYQVECEVPGSFVYEAEKFDDAFRVDIFVNRRLVIELKSSEGMNPVYGKQVLTYLRLMKLPLGLLINFGTAHLKDGIKRIAN